MNLPTHFNKHFEKIQEDLEIWEKEIYIHFPKDLEEQIKNTGVLLRKREVKSASDLLKVLFLYSVTNLSFRILALAASVLGIASISDTAWRKKFLSALPFLQVLFHHLLKTVIKQPQKGEFLHKNVYLVDASIIGQVGKQQPQYRVHLCYDLNQNQINQIKCTDLHTAEGMKHFSFRENDLVLADAGYGTISNYLEIRKQQADALLRVSPNHITFQEKNGTKLDFVKLLKEIEESGDSSYEKSCFIKEGKTLHWVRIVVGKLPKEQAALSQKRKQRKAQKNGSKIKEETLLYAKYVILITSLGAEYDREEILELYRNRWQIELLFKRMKQNLRIHRIRAGSEAYAFTLIYLWLILWLITERNVIRAEQYFLEKENKLERISSWDLYRVFFSKIKIILELSWSLLISEKDYFSLFRYLSTHKARRKNQNRTYQNEIKGSLII